MNGLKAPKAKSSPYLSAALVIVTVVYFTSVYGFVTGALALEKKVIAESGLVEVLSPISLEEYKKLYADNPESVDVSKMLLDYSISYYLLDGHPFLTNDPTSESTLKLLNVVSTNNIPVALDVLRSGKSINQSLDDYVMQSSETDGVAEVAFAEMYLKIVETSSAVSKHFLNAYILMILGFVLWLQIFVTLKSIRKYRNDAVAYDWYTRLKKED